LKKVVLVAGARPNFMKVAPIIDAINVARQQNWLLDYALVHTGQHFDAKMSHDFFVQLGIPQPNINLEAGGGSQAEQTATIMIRFEKYLQENPTEMVMVVGDVTSTLACSIVAKKMCIPLAHVEGGIRSGDMTMPEEINRMVTDSISDYFFTTSSVANANLIKEGKREDQIFFVGNTMIDTLLKNMDRLRPPTCWDTLKLQPKKYLVMTLHRPSNVDNKEHLEILFRAIESGTGFLPIIFPVHPRTRKNIELFNIHSDRFKLIDPQGYLEFNYLVKNALAVITDSGGVTEETTVMGVPCITLRNSTERPETCTIGTNELVGTDPHMISQALQKLISGQWKKGSIPERWDGKTSKRIVDILLAL
jgi:UDP-N-acetylglucosamine 2-epimerase (non-hydrolysing)